MSDSSASYPTTGVLATSRAEAAGGTARSAAKSSLSFHALSLSCLTSNVTALNPPLLSDATSCPNASVATLGEKCAPRKKVPKIWWWITRFSFRKLRCLCVFRFSVFISYFFSLAYFSSLFCLCANSCGIGSIERKSWASATRRWPRPRTNRRPRPRSNRASGRTATFTTTPRRRLQWGTGRAPSRWHQDHLASRAKRHTPGRNRATPTAAPLASEVTKKYTKNITICLIKRTEIFRKRKLCNLLDLYVKPVASSREVSQ